MSYQAWVNLCSDGYHYVRKVGKVRDSEPEAWEEIHAAAMCIWPHRPVMRRTFEGRCEITEEKPDAIRS